MSLLFTNKVYKIIKLISLSGISLLLFTEIYNLFLSPSKLIECYNSSRIIYVNIENFIFIIAFLFLYLFPQKLELLSLMSFWYSIDIFIFDSNNYLGILMYFLGFTLLYVRGYFLKRKKIKILFFHFIFVILIILHSLLNSNNWLGYVIDCLAYIFILCLISIFQNITTSQKIASYKTLNLAEYSSLKESDVQLLEAVLDNKQYKVIAIESKKTEGAIRNRLNRIYDILDVFDKQGFLASYYGCQIVYIPVKTYNQD